MYPMRGKMKRRKRKKMQAILKFYSDGKEVDSDSTLIATVQETNAPFTVQEIAEAIHAAAPPGDPECGDLEVLIGNVRRALSRTLSNPSCAVEAWYLCEDLGNDWYVRRGVPIEPEERERIKKSVPAAIRTWHPSQGLQVSPTALKDPSIWGKRYIEWDDLTPEAQDLLSR
jgi:hypothetical protein